MQYVIEFLDEANSVVRVLHAEASSPANAFTACRRPRLVVRRLDGVRGRQPRSARTFHLEASDQVDGEVTMALQFSALRDALIAAGAPPEKADAAAEEVAAHLTRRDTLSPWAKASVGLIVLYAMAILALVAWMR
jgi:hypothetical protein